MALTLGASYNDDYGRVQITISGASTDADYAKVEHSLDQITWQTIRGGDKVPLSGGAGHVDHYDGYTFGVTNYYRVSAVDAADPAMFGTGSFATANNATLNPALPAGSIPVGAKLVLFVTHANPAATITTPTGWSRLAGGGTNQAIFYRDYAAGVTAPSVAFSGGAAGDSCSAQIRAFTNAGDPIHLGYLANASNQNVDYPQATVPSGLGIMHLWKASVFTGVTGVPLKYVVVSAGGGNNTAGSNDESQLHYFTTPNPGTIIAGTVAYTGGVADVSKARLAYLPYRAFTDQATLSFTPVFPNPYDKPYWLMNPGRPGQNIRVEINGFSEISNDGRTGIFEIVGRSAPVIVSDIMKSDSFEFTIDAATKTEAREIAARLTVGDPMFLLIPDPNADLDTLYFTATGIKRSPDAPGGSWSITVSARQVSQPAPAVYGSTYIWNDVVTDYVSWTAVLSDPQNVTWSNLVDRISDDVIIVP